MRKLRIGFAKSPLTLNILFYPCFLFSNMILSNLKRAANHICFSKLVKHRGVCLNFWIVENEFHPRIDFHVDDIALVKQNIPLFGARRAITFEIAPSGFVKLKKQSLTHNSSHMRALSKFANT